MSERMTSERFRENPFLSDMIVPVRERRVQISRLGRDENVLINQVTGEVHGTHLTTIKRVDADQFVKIFTANIAMAFDLGSAGVKALSVLMFAVQKHALGKDEVSLDAIVLEDFLQNEPALAVSGATFRRGVLELERSKIIAKTLRPGRYWLNPNFVFNGDRVAFTTYLQKTTEKKPKRDPHTIDLLEGKTDAEIETTP